MRVLPLELFNLRLADCRHVIDARSHTVCRLDLPILGITVVGNTGIRLVWVQRRNSNGVYQLGGITIVEGNPYRFVTSNRHREVQSSFGRYTIALENNELTPAEVGALVAIWNLAHALDSFGYTHLLVEYGAIRGQIHATNVVGRVRDIGDLHPDITFSVFINQARLVTCHHLVQLDAGIHLRHHRL